MKRVDVTFDYFKTLPYFKGHLLFIKDVFARINKYLEVGDI